VKDEFFGHDHDVYVITVGGGEETPELTAPWPEDDPSWRPR